MLPKFLIANNIQELPDNVYVIRTHTPKFILKGTIYDFKKDQKLHWIDAPINDPNVIKELIIEAEEFYLNELKSQETIFDIYKSEK